MTPEELSIFRLQAKIEATQIVLVSLVRGLFEQRPNELAAWKKASVEFAATKVVAGVDPAISDLLSAERQEALEDLLSLLV